MTTSMRMSLNRSSTRKYYIRHQEQHLIGCGNFTVDLLCGTELRRKKFKKGKVLHSISGWKFQARISKANPWQDFKFMHMAKPVTTNFDNHRQHISGTLFPAFFFFFFNPLVTFTCSSKCITGWNHFEKLLKLDTSIACNKQCAKLAPTSSWADCMHLFTWHSSIELLITQQLRSEVHARHTCFHMCNIGVH